MENEGLWHLLEHIFGYLDHETVVICRKVSHLWDELLEPLERRFLVDILKELGVKIAEGYHRSHKGETEEQVFTVKSGWNQAVQKYNKEASIEDLNELQSILGLIIPKDDKWWPRPLKTAITLGDLKLLEFLFSTSYDVNDRDGNGRTAFHWACEFGSVETAQWILTFSTDDNPIDLNNRDGDGMTALHWACYNFEIAKWMLQLSKRNDAIDLNARSHRGTTPFHQACRWGKTETAKLLLEVTKENGGIDLNARDDQGRTAFHLACQNYNGAETVNLILNFSKESNAIDLNVRDEDGLTGFHLACENDGEEFNHFLKFILDFSNQNEIIDLNARDNSGMTGLHLVCSYEIPVFDMNDDDEEDAHYHAEIRAFISACYLRKIESVKMILDFAQEKDAIDLNARDDTGRTPFHMTCRQGTTEIAKLFLDSSKANGKIDLNAKDDSGRTGFQVACESGKTETVKLLIVNWKEFGIDIKTKNIEGKTPLDILLGHENDELNEVITMLEEEYAKIDVPDQK